MKSEATSGRRVAGRPDQRAADTRVEPVERIAGSSSRKRAGVRLERRHRLRLRIDHPTAHQGSLHTARTEQSQHAPAIGQRLQHEPFALSIRITRGRFAFQQCIRQRPVNVHTGRPHRAGGEWRCVTLIAAHAHGGFTTRGCDDERLHIHRYADALAAIERLVPGADGGRIESGARQHVPALRGDGFLDDERIDARSGHGGVTPVVKSVDASVT